MNVVATGNASLYTFLYCFRCALFLESETLGYFIIWKISLSSTHTGHRNFSPLVIWWLTVVVQVAYMVAPWGVCSALFWDRQTLGYFIVWKIPLSSTHTWHSP